MSFSKKLPLSEVSLTTGLGLKQGLKMKMLALNPYGFFPQLLLPDDLLKRNEF